MGLGHDLSGEYNGHFFEEGEKQAHASLIIRYLTKSICSFELELNRKEIKLTAVLQQSDQLYNIFITEKYTDDFYIQGDNQSSLSSGTHGVLYPINNEIQLSLFINEYNGKSSRLSFNGFKKKIDSNVYQRV